MKSIDCGGVREALPGVIHGREPASEAMEAHLLSCETCGGELELLRWLHATRPVPSAGMAERVLEAVRARQAPGRHPAWALTAAAVAALALGIGLSSANGTDLVAPAFAQESTEDWPWPSDDGLVAGAPVFDELSEQDLTVLLADLDLEGVRP